jgi:hypothetical protein
MLRLGFVALIVVALVLAVTNPGQETHKQAVYTSLATQATNSEMLGKIAVDVLGDRNIVPLQYNNYYLFSTTTLDGKTESVGAVARVWKWK